MDRQQRSFLERLMNEICPTGYEVDAARVWRSEAATFADRIWGDTHGNSFAVVNEAGSPRVMLAGHIDEIGLMVTHIDDNGFLLFSPIGGWDPQVLPGQRVNIKTEAGNVLGVVGRKAIHLLEPKERDKVVKFEQLWVDIGASGKQAAEEVVRIGDPMVLDYGFSVLRDDLVCARAFDDRIGAFVVLEAGRMAAQMDPAAAIYIVGTVQEEIGLRGAITSAFGIDPHVGIAVDVTHATDVPRGKDVASKAGAISLGRGPVITRGPNINPMVFSRLVAAAKASEIPYQLQGAPRGTGTDANAMQLSRAGVATGLIGVPNRYMHSPCEMVDLRDVENASRLIADTVAALESDATFVLE